MPRPLALLLAALAAASGPAHGAEPETGESAAATDALAGGESAAKDGSAGPRGQTVSDLELIDHDWLFQWRIPNSKWSVRGELNTGQTVWVGTMSTARTVVRLQVLPASAADAEFITEAQVGSLIDALPSDGRPVWDLPTTLSVGGMPIQGEVLAASLLLWHDAGLLWHASAVSKSGEAPTDELYEALSTLERLPGAPAGREVRADPPGNARGPGWAIRDGQYVDTLAELTIACRPGDVVYAGPSVEAVGFPGPVLVEDPTGWGVGLIRDADGRALPGDETTIPPLAACAGPLLQHDSLGPLCFEVDDEEPSIGVLFFRHAGRDQAFLITHTQPLSADPVADGALDRVAALTGEELEAQRAWRRRAGVARSLGRGWALRNRTYRSFEHGIVWVLPDDRPLDVAPPALAERWGLELSVDELWTQANASLAVESGAAAKAHRRHLRESRGWERATRWRDGGRFAHLLVNKFSGRARVVVTRDSPAGAVQVQLSLPEGVADPSWAHPWLDGLSTGREPGDGVVMEAQWITDLRVGVRVPRPVGLRCRVLPVPGIEGASSMVACERGKQLALWLVVAHAPEAATPDGQLELSLDRSSEKFGLTASTKEPVGGWSWMEATGLRSGVGRPGAMVLQGGVVDGLTILFIGVHPTPEGLSALATEAVEGLLVLDLPPD